MQGAKVWGKTRRSFESGALGRAGERRKRMQADQPPVALAGSGQGRYEAGVVIAIEGETRAVTAERDLLVEVVLRRVEGRALQLVLLPAPG